MTKSMVGFIGGVVCSAALLFAETPAEPRVGGGTIQSPAQGPGPATGEKGFVLVKNWDFGRSGTIRNMAEMSEHFQYHDQFNTIANGTHYGGVMVSADKANAIAGQPVEDPETPVREFFDESLRTYLVPLKGAQIVSPREHNVGCGSFVAKWAMPRGGALLKQDMIFETRVRYVTPPYFWFAIWTCGEKWNKGAEMDVVESFGYDNGGGITNYDGRFWHSDAVGGTNTIHYGNWGKAMREQGVLTADRPAFDATQYHVWTWLYRSDDTYSVYLDGIEVQKGVLHWTLSGKEGGQPLTMYFLFDGTWGHTDVKSVNRSMPASELAGKYYEWDYSRVYLRPSPDAAATIPAK